jgi:hypothetical protein
MADRNSPALQIGQLNLSVPGQGAEAGHRVANGVTESLAQQLPAGLQGHYGALNVRVPMPAGASEGEMSAAIAGAIISALQRGHGVNQRAPGEWR